MKQTGKIHFCQKLMLGMLSLVLAAGLWLGVDFFSTVSLAESPAKVTAASANIRKSADPDSEILAGVKKDDNVSIKAQTKGSDGAVWYQVFVDSEQLGFIRSNLVSITDGSTPPTTTETTTNTAAGTVNQTTAAPTAQNVSTAPKAVVTEVNPTSATVLNAVRVRSDASTNSTILARVEAGVSLTVTGWATDSDNYKWWRVTCTVDGTEVTGFIRSDYVEAINPTEPGNEEPTNPAQEPEPVAEPEEPKAWEIQEEGDTWWLIDSFGQYSEDHLTPQRYDIANMFKTVSDNKQAYNDAIKSAKNLKIVVIILVLLIVVLAAFITILIFKLRDMDDSAYFAEVERETARRRSADRPQQRPMQGGGQRPQGQGQRPVQGGGQRPQGQGQRPVQGGGQRPQGQGQRPVQGGGARPQGQGQRSVQGGGARPQGQGQRPVQGSGQRPAPGRRPAQNPQEASGPRGPVRPQAENQGTGQKPGWKSKNFMDDEEEEFEFLRWDEDEQ
ncbi:MAG: SH3 domain-containing protein [Bacteroidales bacterium]|nr:SH3 domain-containing protein [Lachnoclostridium sp.]MCM1384795.1 SH3 domain-containing protein [Lachnoclostridium sp.]MCM1465061.1 SH3 domain-containing protein [Bacteroidales bacterium]